MGLLFLLEVVALIELDESEHYFSVFTDDVLRQILNICGQECKDKLLMYSEPWVVVTLLDSA